MQIVISFYTNFALQSLIDRTQLSQLNTSANKIAAFIASGDWTAATLQWSALEDLVEEVTAGVNFYNIQQWNNGQLKNPYITAWGM